MPRKLCKIRQPRHKNSANTTKRASAQRLSSKGYHYSTWTSGSRSRRRRALRLGWKQIDAISQKPITHAFAYSPTGSDQDSEIIVVDITFPPSKQIVWRITRYVRFEPGKEPVPETLLTALRQKYGQEVSSSIPENTFWVFDQQGRPAGRSSGINLADCAMYVEHGYAFGAMNTAASSGGIAPGVALYPTAVVANRDACQAFVYVAATTTPSSNREAVQAISVTVTDLGAG